MKAILHFFIKSRVQNHTLESLETFITARNPVNRLRPTRGIERIGTER